MSELRRKQKEKREKAIIEAAKSLITEKGYRNTSIEDIAKEAEVGVATVYNYFSTKQELFLYFAFDKASELLKSGRKVLDNPPKEARTALFALLKAYCGMAKKFDKKLLREIHVVAFVALPHVRKKLMGIDIELIEQITRLVELIQKRGQFSTELDAREVASMLYSTHTSDLMAYILNDDITLNDLYEINKRHIQLSTKNFI